MKTATILKTFFLLLLLSSTALAQVPKTSEMKTLKSKGYVPVNGLKMYYEIHGEGRPLLLLHGSFMTIDLNWNALLPELAKTRQVIAVEMQGHGHTADIDRAISYQGLADDAAGLLKHLKIDSADVLGYSLGGTVAFALAIRHPQLVRKMVLISTVYKYKGWMPETLDVFHTFKPGFLDNTPLKPAYESVAPDPKHWSQFVNKYIDLDQKDFDLDAGNIKAIKAPALIIMGDNDGVSLEHKTEMYRLFGGGVFGDMTGLPRSQMAILPGTTHVGLMMETQKLAAIIPPFLDNEPVPVQH